CPVADPSTNIIHRRLARVGSTVGHPVAACGVGLADLLHEEARGRVVRRNVGGAPTGGVIGAERRPQGGLVAAEARLEARGVAAIAVGVVASCLETSLDGRERDVRGAATVGRFTV